MKTRRQKKVSDDRITTNRRNTRSTTLFSIPIDLLIDIFSRLPLKSIATCRCVSKLWSSILIRPDFTELFLTISSTRPQILFACEKNGNFCFFSSPQSQSSPLIVNKLPHFDGSCEITGLVNGLVCLVYVRISNGKKQRVAMICGPSTGQALALPKVKSKRVDVRYLFGYDPIGKQFKVLSMTRLRKRRDNDMCEEHQVLTLGDGKMSWRMIECCVPQSYSYHLHEQICIDGVLYYPSVDRSRETYLIVCFDVRSEKFSFVDVKETLNVAVWMGTLVNYNGKLGLFLPERSYSLNHSSTSFKVWVLEGIGKNEWSERTYLLPSLWRKLVGVSSVCFVGVTRTNEIVFSRELASDSLFYVIYFNLETNDIARVEIQGMDAFEFSRVHTFINHVEDVKLM